MPIRRACLMLFGLASLFAFSCGRGATWPVPLEPALQEAKGYDVREKCQTFENREVLVSVCPVGSVEAAGAYSGGEVQNPFGDGVESMARLVFFSVRLENRSQEKLYFNPLWASLFAGNAVPSPPLDVSDIHRIHRGSADVEAKARAFRQTVFDGTWSVAGGDAVERYLVFAAPKGAFEEMTVLLQDLYLGSRDFDPAFVFRPAHSGSE